MFLISIYQDYINTLSWEITYKGTQYILCVLLFIYLLMVVLLRSSSVLGWRFSSVIIIDGAQSGWEVLKRSAGFPERIKYTQ